MPGSNARALEKASTLAADARDPRPRGRRRARRQGCWRAQQVSPPCRRAASARAKWSSASMALDTPWGEADPAAAAAAAPDAILVPKVSSPAHIAAPLGHAPARLRRRRAHPALGDDRDAARHPGRRRSRRRRTTPTTRLSCFVMGTNDLAKETRARLVPGRARHAALADERLAAARAYGIDILDGVYNDLSDEAGLPGGMRAGPRFRLRRQDPDPPDQIAVANEVFAPSAEEVERARAIDRRLRAARERAARARSSWTAAWSSGCMPRWASEPSRYQRLSPAWDSGDCASSPFPQSPAEPHCPARSASSTEPEPGRPSPAPSFPRRPRSPRGSSVPMAPSAVPMS